MSRWGKFTDFGTDDRPVRARLLRRIASGSICGFVSPQTQRACLATPTEPGARCHLHGGSAPGFASKERSPASVLVSVLSTAMSAEDASALNDLYAYGPVTLDDQIGLLRLRIVDLERQFRNGEVRIDEYRKALIQLTDQLRKLVETNSKIALNQALAERFAPEDAPELFDPVKEVAREAAAPEQDKAGD